MKQGLNWEYNQLHSGVYLASTLLLSILEILIVPEKKRVSVESTMLHNLHFNE